jgi:hypothetical protein
MKKLLVLVAVLALVAAMVVPMAAFADTGSTQINAETVGPSVQLTPPAFFDMGTLNVGRNPVTNSFVGVAGSVTFSQGSDAASTCVLSAISINAGSPYDFLNGCMYSANTSKYLNDPMYVTFDNITYAQLPGGVHMSILPGNTPFNLGAVQVIQPTENPGVGTYYIVVTLNAVAAP